MATSSPYPTVENVPQGNASAAYFTTYSGVDGAIKRCKLPEKPSALAVRESSRKKTGTQ
jgi:hypothetical protein